MYNGHGPLPGILRCGNEDEENVHSTQSDNRIWGQGGTLLDVATYREWNGTHIVIVCFTTTTPILPHPSLSPSPMPPYSTFANHSIFDRRHRPSAHTIHPGRFPFAPVVSSKTWPSIFCWHPSTDFVRYRTFRGRFHIRANRPHSTLSPK